MKTSAEWRREALWGRITAWVSAISAVAMVAMGLYRLSAQGYMTGFVVCVSLALMPAFSARHWFDVAKITDEIAENARELETLRKGAA